MLTVQSTNKFANAKRDGRRSMVNTTRDGLILTIMLSVNKSVTRFVPNIPRPRSVSNIKKSNSVSRRVIPRNVSSLLIENSVLLKRRLVSVPNGF